MDHQERGFSDIAEDLGSSLHTHMAAHNNCSSRSRRSNTALASPGGGHTCGEVHTCRHT